VGRKLQCPIQQRDGVQLLVYFLPILLVGRKLQCQTQHRDGARAATLELPGCRSVGTTGTDGQRTDDGNGSMTGWRMGRTDGKDDRRKRTKPAIL